MTLQESGAGAFFACVHETVLAIVAGVCNALTMQDLLTAKQKAEELGISRSTLTRMVQAGKITPAFKADGANGVTLFHVEDVAA